ncbi:MAG: hypothetical protein ACI9BH_000494 [Paracoccaceae bacterium]|jgi:hypothetical protein
MLINLHSQAATTPKVRAEIQASDEPAWVLAERYGNPSRSIVLRIVAESMHSNWTN